LYAPAAGQRQPVAESPEQQLFLNDLALKRKGYPMLEALKQQVYEANMELPRRGLVTYTWGNVSGIDREKGLFVIKPSGVEYDELTPEMLVVMDLNGNKIEGELKPSSDTKTHLELYKAFSALGGIVHTHSTHAVAFAQARRALLGVVAFCRGVGQAP